MIPGIKEIIRGLQKEINQKIQKAVTNFIARVQVKEVYEAENGQWHIRATTLTTGREITDIKLLGTRVGNGRGIIAYPKSGDVGLVINALGEYFYLGSMYDEYTAAPDNQIKNDMDGVFIVANSFGSYIAVLSNEDIVLKTKSGAKIRINEAGNFQLFNKTNHGIEVDADGVMTIRGTTINHTQSGGTWQDL